MLVGNLRLPILLLRLCCPSLHVRNSGVPKRLNSTGTASVLKMCQGTSSSSQIHREQRQRALQLTCALTLASGYTWHVSAACYKRGIDSNMPWRREGHIGEWLHEESGAHGTPERCENKGPDRISSEGTTSI